MAKVGGTGQTCLSSVYMSEEMQGIGKKKSAKELKGRERADSLSMDYMRGGEKEKGKEYNKRKREEIERLADKIFKKIII